MNVHLLRVRLGYAVEQLRLVQRYLKRDHTGDLRGAIAQLEQARAKIADVLLMFDD